MAVQQLYSGDQQARGASRPSPQTDPTNPYRQESTGEWLAAETETERHQDEPGLTHLDRQERDPATGAAKAGG